MTNRRSAALSIIRSNPNIVSGVLVFGCMFALIAGNAIYSQPGAHPGPILNTRDSLTTNSLQQHAGNRQRPGAASRRATQAPGNKYLDLATLENIAVPTRRPRPETSVSKAVDASSDKPAALSGKLLARTQQKLKTLGLYEGVVDGLYGPATRRAIETYQLNAGLDKTGKPSPSLLFSISRTIGLVAPDNAGDDRAGNTPAGEANETIEARSVEAIPTPKESAANILEAPLPGIGGAGKIVEASAVAAPKAEETAIDEQTTAAVEQDEAVAGVSAQAQQREMIRLVQKGLAVFGVEGIEADGVLNLETVDALKRFQERYQLKTSGQPDESTIRKMLEIGALRKG